MGYENMQGGRVADQASEAGSFWTFDAVVERLVETMDLWRRSPGGGRWPFAGDGPWHLVSAMPSPVELAEFELGRAQMAHDERPRSLPLSRSEVGLRDEVTEWLSWVPEDKRRVVVLAVIDLARGFASPRWSAMLPKLGLTIGAGGVEYRYSQGIQFIANVLNAMSGMPYAPKGRRLRYPRAVLDVVERLKMAENCGCRPSSPRMCE